MKIAKCDVCGSEEEFTDKCPLTTKEVCKNCNSNKPIIDKPVGITLGPSPSKEFTKKYCMPPKEGLIVSDIDNVFYNYNTNEIRLVEFKSRTMNPYFDKYGQWSLYRTLDSGLSSKGEKYKGVYVVWTDEYKLVDAKVFKINSMKVNRQDVIDLMNLKQTIYEQIDFSDFDIYKKESQ